jgi:putative FmdB family regulatory protein
MKMPIYEYRCQSCGHELEKLQRLSDPVLTDCPECAKAQLKRLISAAGFRLKGAGWYETDFKQSNQRNLADSSSGKGDGAGSSGSVGESTGGITSSSSAASEAKSGNTTSSDSSAGKSESKSQGGGEGGTKGKSAPKSAPGSKASDGAAAKTA